MLGILLSLFLSNACTLKSGKQIDCSLISVNLEKKAIDVSALFNSIQPLFLETTDLSLIGAEPKIDFTETRIFIRSGKTLKVFDYEGRFLNNIGKAGSGNGEYSGISDFYINEKLERVEILDKSRRKIVSYNYDGEYLLEDPFDFWAVKMTRDNQNVLYIYSGNEKNAENSLNSTRLTTINTLHSIKLTAKGANSFIYQHLSTFTKTKRILFFSSLLMTLFIRW